MEVVQGLSSCPVSWRRGDYHLMAYSHQNEQTNFLIADIKRQK
jgi:hypothetical protein